ncbi:unnamed protein product [Ilex paraguariensis]|uniref:F-box protein n=1 Tax=Ilex paraguariensis TaxID=185542 RepID=A0ABC8UUT6_9AQUA
MSSCSSTTTTTNPTSTSDMASNATAITDVHPDIIRTHILTKLDGPSLASTSSASSHLQSLSSEDELWREVCNSTWPSTTDPLVSATISSFSSGHRSFFCDAFPTFRPFSRPSHPNRRPWPSVFDLISAVDVHYKNKLVFSQAHLTETVSLWFQCSLLRVDLLDYKETVPTPVKFAGDEETCRADLEEHMSLSWILIDPTHKRAVNLSSLRPVSVKRHWLTGDFLVRYATILAGDLNGDRWESVQCSLMVTCVGEQGGELQVKEVSMQVEDMDGMILSGNDGLVFLQEAMESERRKRGKRGEERERYEEYLEIRRERTEKNQGREWRLDKVFIATGIIIFLAFWAFVL